MKSQKIVKSSAYNAPNFAMYIKVYRKYFKRHYGKRAAIRHTDPPYFVQYDVTTLEQVAEVRNHPKYISDNLSKILDEFETHIGDDIEWQCDKGVFVGIRITDFDYYYLYDVDGVRHKQSCVAGFCVIDAR